MNFADPERAKKHLIMDAARQAVAGAVAAGTLVRPSVCQSCGKADKRSIQGHHEDYSKPLDVIWLCQACHSRRHPKKKRPDGFVKPIIPKKVKPRSVFRPAKRVPERITASTGMDWHDYKNLVPKMPKFKSLPDKRRRLTQREESAVALIALRMVIAEREWNPGDAPVVRMLDMMFRVLEYQIAAKAFGGWLTRLGIQTLRRGGRKLVVVPVSFDEAESALRKLTGAGHTLATAVKPAILEHVSKLNQATHEEGAVKGSHSVPGSPEGYRDQEIGSCTMGNNSDCSQAAIPARSPLTPAGRRTMEPPPEPRKPINDFLDEEED